jgi:hypothetical protein
MNDTADQLRADIGDAIAAYLAKVAPGKLLTDWVFIAAAAHADAPDATTYSSDHSGGPAHTRYGLVRYLALHYDADMAQDDD